MAGQPDLGAAGPTERLGETVIGRWVLGEPRRAGGPAEQRSWRVRNDPASNYHEHFEIRGETPRVEAKVGTN